MCGYEVSDIKCAARRCQTIISFKGSREPFLCETAKENGLEFGGCGTKNDTRTGPAVRAQWQLCGPCYTWSQEKSRENYENAAQNVTRAREAEERADDQRRQRLEGYHRSVTPMPQDQNALLHSAGTGWADYSGLYDLGGSGAPLGSGMDVSAMPQELDLDDTGEDIGQVSGQGYGQRGDGRHDQRGGQGSGGGYWQ